MGDKDEAWVIIIILFFMQELSIYKNNKINYKGNKNISWSTRKENIMNQQNAYDGINYKGYTLEGKFHKDVWDVQCTSELIDYNSIEFVPWEGLICYMGSVNLDKLNII